MNPIALATTALLAAAAPATAAPLKLRDAGPVDAVVHGDGARYIVSANANANANAATLLDTRTGRRSAIAVPPGCDLADMHHGVVLWRCPAPTGIADGSATTYDVASGQSAPLPLIRADPGSPSGELVRYAELGDAWARVTVEGYHYAKTRYVDRSTGLEHAPFTDRRDLAIDLDRRPLTRALCDGQRRAIEINLDDVVDAYKLGGLQIAGRWAAALTYASLTRGGAVRMELQRCGRRPRAIACSSAACSQPVIDSRLVAWSETRGSTRRRSRLVVRFLRDGRTRATTWRSGAMAQPLLVGRRLYVVRAGRLKRAAL